MPGSVAPRHVTMHNGSCRFNFDESVTSEFDVAATSGRDSFDTTGTKAALFGNGDAYSKQSAVPGSFSQGHVIMHNLGQQDETCTDAAFAESTSYMGIPANG